VKDTILTKSEQKAFDILVKKSGIITSRDDIAQAIWGELWLQKYSDWRIDRLIYLLRQKIQSSYKIKTIRNSGYVLFNSEVDIPHLSENKVQGIMPTQTYLEYMNNSENPRKVLEDLFNSIKIEGSPKNIIVINSYSCDNINTMSKYFKKSHVYFSNFDQRALDIHQERIEKLGLINFYTAHDDIRNSVFKDNYFDLVINDFRINFNTSDSQNIAAMKNMYRISSSNSQALISVVVDPRYESNKFGENQDRAPTNKDKPWTFSAQENLTRFCFTIPYYKRLFKQTGFKIIKEFDIDNGKKWNPPYRRFLLQK